MGEIEKTEGQEVQTGDDGSVVATAEESIVALEILPKKRGRKPGTGIPRSIREKVAAKRKSEILELTAAGATVNQIAKATECSRVYVSKVRKQFKHIFKSLDKVENFRTVKSDILDAAQLEMLKSAVSPEKLKKAPLGQIAYSFRQFYDANRLEIGKSTQNTAVSFTNKIA